MIRRGWIVALAALSAGVLGLAIVLALVTAQLEKAVDARYFAEDVWSLPFSEQEPVFLQSALASALQSIEVPLATAGLLAGIAALALFAYGAGIRSRAATVSMLSARRVLE